MTWKEGARWGRVLCPAEGRWADRDTAAWEWPEWESGPGAWTTSEDPRPTRPQPSSRPKAPVPPGSVRPPDRVADTGLGGTGLEAPFPWPSLLGRCCAPTSQSLPPAFAHLWVPSPAEATHRPRPPPLLTRRPGPQPGPPRACGPLWGHHIFPTRGPGDGAVPLLHPPPMRVTSGHAFTGTLSALCAPGALTLRVWQEPMRPFRP